MKAQVAGKNRLSPWADGATGLRAMRVKAALSPRLRQMPGGVMEGERLGFCAS